MLNYLLYASSDFLHIYTLEIRVIKDRDEKRSEFARTDRDPRHDYQGDAR